jgi:cytoskeleton protein RodZ
MNGPDAQPGPEGGPDQRLPPRSPGAVLLAERRSQGLSLGDVARQLKLSVRQVEALERDEYGAFSGSVFVRGFLRNYAKLLRLDPERLLEAAGASIAPTRAAESELAEMPISAPNPEGRRRLLTWSAFAVLAVVVLLLLASNVSREQRQTQMAERPAVPGTSAPPHAESPPAPVSQTPAEPVPAAPPTLEQETVPGASREPGKAEAIASPAAAQSRSGGPDVLPSSGEPSGEAPAVAKPRVLVTGSGSNQIRMIFEDESWVEVKDGTGETILSRLNAPGTERLIRGQPPFVVVVGNARAVKLLYRGKPIDLSPHTRIDVARVTLE